MLILILMALAIAALYHIFKTQDYQSLQNEPYYFIIETPDIQLNGDRGLVMERGFANGYVRIPLGHIFYNQPYWPDYSDETELANKIREINIHGGLTYSGEIRRNGEYVFGFDTAYANDNKTNWNEAAVLSETKNLYEQILKAK